MYRRTLFFVATLALLVFGSLAPTRAALAAAPRYFPETQHNLQGGFLEYWTGHGTLAQQGYPLTEEFPETSPLNGQTYNVQYFERAVFEYHPENAGTAYTILLSQLGTFRYHQKYPSGAPNQSPHQAGGQYFAQTGHWLGGGFLTYWQQHGSVAQQGYPISDEFQEISDLDGKPYQVQYFERAVFEYHPENAGTPYTILLAQLGKFALQSRYPNNSLAAAAPQPAPVGQAPGATPTPPPPGGTLEEAQYLLKALDLNHRLQAHLQTATTLLQLAAPTDATWVSAFQDLIQQANDLATEASALPTPPRFQGSHALLVSGLQHMARGEDLFLQAARSTPFNQALASQAEAEIKQAADDYTTSNTVFDQERGAPSPAATPTPAPPPPSGGAYTAVASVSDPAPTHNERVTVNGLLAKGGQPLAGVTMHTVWSYKTVTETCDGTTDANGRAACTRDISRATSGYLVRIDVVFLDSGGAVLASTQTSFTPK